MATSGDLLRHAVRGDEDALVQLLERHGPALRRHIAEDISPRWRSVLGAEDVMQQTYSDAFLDIGTFEGGDEAAFSAWLARMARHNLLDAVEMLQADKRGGNRRRIEPQNRDDSTLTLFHLLGGTSTTPSRVAARKEAAAALAEAIPMLPDDYRRVIEMYDLEARPLKEVAETLERKPGAVCMLRVRAHRRLAQIMGTASKFLGESG